MDSKSAAQGGPAHQCWCAVQARKAMASTMKTWFDNTSWRPKLVTAAFVGAKVAASERIEAPFQVSTHLHMCHCKA